MNIGSYDKSRRQGTHRYMAPEVIMQSYHPDSFDAYKASDVYSFSLVMWEIANRTMIKGIGVFVNFPARVGGTPICDFIYVGFAIDCRFP